MLRRGLGGLGLLSLVAVIAGCTSTSAPSGDRAGEVVSVPGYVASPDAPDFCGRLAETTHVGQIPAAVGMLTVRDGDASSVRELEKALGELEGVLDEVSGDDRHAAVTAALEDLLASLHSATSNPIDDALLDRLATRLESLGAEVQPLCEFPT